MMNRERTNIPKKKAWERGLTVPETRCSHGSYNRFLQSHKREKNCDKGHNKYSYVFFGMSLALILLFTGIGVACATTIIVHQGESIQAAIDSLPPEGGVVELETGTFMIESDRRPPLQ